MSDLLIMTAIVAAAVIIAHPLLLIAKAIGNISRDKTSNDRELPAETTTEVKKPDKLAVDKFSSIDPQLLQKPPRPMGGFGTNINTGKRKSSSQSPQKDTDKTNQPKDADKPDTKD